MLPNIFWLIQHQFASLHYAVERPEDPGTWYHIIRPLQFLASQGLVLAPAFLVFIPCFWGAKRALTLHSFDRQFLAWFAVAPLALTLLVSLVTSMRLRSIYGMPLFTVAGLWLVACTSPLLAAEQFHKTIRNIGVVFSLSAVALFVSTHMGPPYMTHESKHANFPGPEIARRLTEEWHARYHRPLAYVAGEHWLSGSVAFYSLDRPTAYFYWNPAISFWVDEKRVEQEGAIFIWNARRQGVQLPSDLLARFPRIIQMPAEQFQAPFFAFPNPVPPTVLGIAFLPPLP